MTTEPTLSAPMTLVIGNKNYSSWSMRAGLAVALTGAAVEEILIPLDEPETAASIRRFSPAGRVPTLMLGDVAVWDSLAICETLADRFPAAGLWPTDPVARAVARAVVAEMHSGFPVLREECSMDLRRRGRQPRGDNWQEEVRRIDALWGDCLERFGGAGGFLFDQPTIADCFYAPMVSRFVTYDLPVSERAAAYIAHIRSWAPYRAWTAAAAAEPWDLGDDH